MIFSTLIPFFIIASLLLLAFAYAFLIQGNPACPNLLDCYAWTLQGFFSGSDDTDDILDVLFGVVAIVVLLNVVIAIVSEAWDSAATRAINLFWKFRLDFLAEARFFAYMDKRLCRGGIVEGMGDYIDTLKDVSFVDHTPWSKAPYSKVKSKKQYDDPSDYFPSDVAAKIVEAQCLQADLYWTKMDSKRKERPDAEKRLLYIIVVLKWFANLMAYGFLLLMGLVSAGWLWPKTLRRRVLAIGVMSERSRKK